MQILWVVDSTGQEFWGPYSDRDLAERVLKIAQKAVDELAELRIMDTDEHAKPILSGLLPFKVHVDIVNGEVQLPAEVHITGRRHQLKEF